MKRLFLAVVALFVFGGCGDSSTTAELYDDTRNDKEDMDNSAGWKEVHHRPYYITEYIAPKKLAIGTTTSPMYVYLRTIGDIHETWDPTKELSEEAKYFAELYGDTNYTGEVSRRMNVALAYPLDWITLVCDKDFDAEHPAGEPLLGDVVKYEFSTMYDFVKSGYTAYNPSNKLNNERVRYELGFDEVNADVSTLIEVGLSTLTPYPLELRYSAGGIRFQYEPEVPGDYTFTLSAQINGEVMTTTFTSTFE